MKGVNGMYIHNSYWYNRMKTISLTESITIHSKINATRNYWLNLEREICLAICSTLFVAMNFIQRNRPFI